MSSVLLSVSGVSGAGIPRAGETTCLATADATAPFLSAGHEPHNGKREGRAHGRGDQPAEERAIRAVVRE